MGYIICEWEFCSNLLWAHHSGASWRSHKIKKVVYWAMKKSRVVLKFEGCAQKNGIIFFFLVPNHSNVCRNFCCLANIPTSEMWS